MPLTRRTMLGAPWLLVGPLAQATPPNEIVGAYSLAQMRSIKGLTFPRLHLYNAKGALIDRQNWPSELAAVKDHAGQAFCCVSDKPSPAGSLGPPPDCKPVVYGQNVLEHFGGLHDPKGLAITYQTLPKHRYMLVEYYADWYAPCQPARQALQAFLSTPASRGYLALVVDFSKLQTSS